MDKAADVLRNVRLTRRGLLGLTLLVCCASVVAAPMLVTSRTASATAGAQPTWTLDNSVGSVANPDGGEFAVSCADMTTCMAIQAASWALASLQWSGHSWSAVPFAAPGGGLDQWGDGLQMNDASCPTESFCMAVGEVTQGARLGFVQGGITEEFDGTSWSVISNPASSLAETRIWSVSCSTVSSCYAVGQGESGGFILDWDGTSWSLALSNLYDVTLFGISCSSPTACVAVGAGAYGVLVSYVLQSGTWTAMTPPDPGDNASLEAVSCTSPTFCMAVGSVMWNTLAWSLNLTEIFNGTTWTEVPSPDYPPNYPASGDPGGGDMTAVSCINTAACVAVGYGEVPEVESWDGTSWTITPSAAPMVVPDEGSSLRGVSCLPDDGNAWCTAVGDDGSSVVERSDAAIANLVPTATSLTLDGGGNVVATVTDGAPSPTGAALAAIPSAGLDHAQLDLAPAPAGASGASGASGGASPGSITILDNGLPMTGCETAVLDSSNEVACQLPVGTTGLLTAAYSGSTTYDGSAASMNAPSGPTGATGSTSTTYPATTVPPTTTPTTTSPPPTTTEPPSTTSTTTAVAPTSSTTTTEPIDTTSTIAPPTTSTTVPTSPIVPAAAPTNAGATSSTAAPSSTGSATGTPTTTSSRTGSAAMASCSHHVVVRPATRFVWTCTLNDAATGRAVTLIAKVRDHNLRLGAGRVQSGGMLRLRLLAPDRSEAVSFVTWKRLHDAEGAGALDLVTLARSAIETSSR